MLWSIQGSDRKALRHLDGKVKLTIGGVSGYAVLTFRASHLFSCCEPGIPEESFSRCDRAQKDPRCWQGPECGNEATATISTGVEFFAKAAASEVRPGAALRSRDSRRMDVQTGKPFHG